MKQSHLYLTPILSCISTFHSLQSHTLTQFVLRHSERFKYWLNSLWFGFWRCVRTHEEMKKRKKYSKTQYATCDMKVCTLNIHSHWTEQTVFVLAFGGSLWKWSPILFKKLLNLGQSVYRLMSPTDASFNCWY